METESQEVKGNVIRLENANISHKDHKVLSEVNVVVNKGEFVFLIGKNGSGKSSFLKTLYAELKLNEG